MNVVKIFLTAIIVNIIFVGGLLFAVYDISSTQIPINNIITQTKKVFTSEEECIKATNKICQFQMCDYIPDDQTFEETCGADFKKGWVPVE